MRTGLTLLSFPELTVMTTAHNTRKSAGASYSPLLRFSIRDTYPSCQDLMLWKAYFFRHKQQCKNIGICHQSIPDIRYKPDQIQFAYSA